jgi:hypothetical protein
MKSQRLIIMSDTLRLIIAIGIGSLLIACGQLPSARDVPPDANFSANILDNGTKLFTFSTRLPHQQRDEDNIVRRGEQRSEERPRAYVDRSQSNKKALQAMLLENAYCRDGYVILEMFEDRTDYVIRGECRDTANDADRERYSHR